MKLLTLFLGLFYVLNANAQFGMSAGASTDLVCNVYRSMGRLENGMLIYPCISSDKQGYGIGFANIPMNLPQAAKEGSKLLLKFHCTVKSPKGLFPFGGETIGYETTQEKHERFFYGVGQGNYGRCYFSSDSALTKYFPLKMNQSAVVFVPVAVKRPVVAN